MKAQHISGKLVLIVLVGLLVSSCGNIDIVKRRYRPGFHVEVLNKKNHRTVTEVAEVKQQNLSVEPLETKPVEQVNATKQNDEPAASDVLVASVEEEPVVKTRKSDPSNVSEALLHPFKELKKEKLNGELRRAVFQGVEDEKFGWSVLGIVSTGLGVIGLSLVITGLAFLTSFIFSGGIAFWWIFALVGLFFGIAAMVTGIIGLRETGRGEKRGRGFALAGMISGIVSLALALIGLLWGAIYTFIQRVSEN
ncbi:MAG: hypothetical protein GC178_07120 [Flavobacteriales bacterium]|nr:hypothetical protein [Flavobacteriales bacterium]